MIIPVLDTVVVKICTHAGCALFLDVPAYRVDYRLLLKDDVIALSHQNRALEYDPRVFYLRVE
jgi:hypothetical protein